jgi:Flavodoxins
MKAKFFFCVAFLAVLLTACTQQTGNLVVYYSQTGNTRAVAELFAPCMHAELIGLDCVKPYPDDFNATIEESRDEVKNSTGRDLVNGTLKLEKYDTICIGFPIWYGTFAPPIVTLAKENNLFAGKTVVLFCTYGSGGRRSAEAQFRTLCPEANVVASFGIAARRVEAAPAEVEAFVASLRAGEAGRQLVGGFSELRDLEEGDREVFAKATEQYGYLHLNPLKVSTQVVAGTNYLFECESAGPDGQASTVEVRIFAPLPGRGEPEVISVER